MSNSQVSMPQYRVEWVCDDDRKGHGEWMLNKLCVKSFVEHGNAIYYDKIKPDENGKMYTGPKIYHKVVIKN